MSELQVVGILCGKRSELAGIVGQLERRLAEHRADLIHLDATIRLFDPDVQPDEIRPKQPRAHSAWFRPGECLRLIYDELREVPQPLATRELVDRIMRVKAMTTMDDRQRALFQKTVLASLNRAKETIARVEIAGLVRWTLR
jgi:hypothetical protein